MRDITFTHPVYLWLLVIPAVLAAAALWRTWQRRRDLSRLVHRRTAPLRERFRLAGDLPLWFSVILAIACLVLALARPQSMTTTPRRAGLDVIVLQDASASMRVADVVRAIDRESPAMGRPATERWRRSMQFLRRFGDALSWRDDRIALVAFAHLATPQIRLTRDPNTLFFFLDHFEEKPPFRIEDDRTWNTNLERAIDWGLRLLDKDEELHGRSRNVKVFVMISDGEAWSGEVARALAQSAKRGIPIFVVGVGTLSGGRLPIVKGEDGEELAIDGPVISRLDRPSLQRIAAEGGGQYFELDRDTDRDIGNTIVSTARRLAPAVSVEQRGDELYWWFLGAATAFAAAGLLFTRDRSELLILFVGAILSAAVLAPLLW